ncbi:MAG: VUT family protein [Armatimonadetes bacterium]|nr:VUT family protein [Armatimonadota bacterium]
METGRSTRDVALAVLACGVYVGCVLLAQATASAFIHLPLGISVAVGTLWFGCTFTMRDHVHAVLGRRGAYIMIWVAIAASCAETIVLGVPPRIILASVIATAMAESADTEIYHANRSRAWLARVLRSNSVSIPIDTVVFNLVAFAGVLGWGAMLGLTVGDMLTKAVMGALVGLVRAGRRSPAGATA